MDDSWKWCVILMLGGLVLAVGEAAWDDYLALQRELARIEAGCTPTPETVP